MTTDTESKAAYGSVPVTHDVETVAVAAPSTMKEGFVFNAMHNGVVFPVTVPSGGVKEGDVIQAPIVPSDATGSGVWKDDIFACTRYGIFHPSFLCACCCQFILLAQVMTRLKLDWKASPAQGDEWKKTFRNVVVISVIYGVLSMLLTAADVDVDVDFDDVASMFAITINPDTNTNPLLQFINVVYALYILYVVTKARKLVREMNGIPEKHCAGCEDVACACCCTCCTVSQLARQTTDYDTEEGAFFTIDGLKKKKTDETEPLAPDVMV